MKALYLFRLRLGIYLSIITLATTVACSCAWVTPEHFCRSILETNHVILGVVVEKPQWYSMDVQVIEDIHLQSDVDTISILGKDGFNCGEWLEKFEIGDTLILALYDGEFYDAVDNSPFGWHLGNCGLFYLRYSNGMVEGAINFGEEAQMYDDFKSDIMTCIDLTSSTDIFEDKFYLQVQVRPNPTADYIDIIIDGSNTIAFSFDVLDLSGNVIRSNIIITDKNKRIDLTNVDPGIYFLRSKNTSENITKKFIKI